MSYSNKKIEVIDIFCGAGGLSYGLKEAGMSILAGFDIDIAGKYAFENNTKGKFYHKDIRNVLASEVDALYSKNTIKVLAGCAPCQPFSSYTKTTVSKNSNKKDGKWKLLLEFQRIVNEVNPHFLTVENVSGLAKEDIWKDFLSFLKRKNYNYKIKVINCIDIGMAQNRKRLVLLASRLGEIDINLPILKGKKTVANIIKELPKIKHGLQNDKDPLHISAKLSDINLKRIKNSIQGGTWKTWPPDLQLSCHKKKSGLSYCSVYGRMSWNKPSPTITTQCYGYGNGRFGHPEQDRAISLREAALLQSFPKNYKFFNSKKNVSISILGRLIGNAVPPKLAKIVGNSIINSLKE